MAFNSFIVLKSGVKIVGNQLLLVGAIVASRQALIGDRLIADNMTVRGV